MAAGISCMSNREWAVSESIGQLIAAANPLATDAETLAVLEFMAQVAEVPFDPTRAAQAVRAAVREIPPTVPRAARLRLTYAAEILGIELTVKQLSIREALAFVAEDTPLATFSLTSVGSAQWFILSEAQGDSGRFADIGSMVNRGWMSAEVMAETLGAIDADSVLEWLVARPAMPMAEAAQPLQAGQAGHGGHVGSHPHRHAGHMSPFQRLLGLLQPEINELWMVILFALGIGVLTLATPVVAMAVVNTVALGTLVQQLLVLCIALLIALGLAALMTLLQTVVVEYMQRRVFVRVAADLAYRLPRVDLRAFDRQHGPELVNRFFAVLTVQKAAATLLLDGVSLSLQILIGLLLLSFYHTYLLGFDLILIGSLVFLFFVAGRGAVRTSIEESFAKYRVAGWMEEMARHPLAFKISGGPQFAMEQTDKLTREYLLARRAHFTILMRQIAFALMLQVVVNVALLAIGGALVIRGELTLGQLVAAEIVVTLVVATFAKLGKQLEAYYDLLAAVDKLGHLLDLPLERDGGERHHAYTRGAQVTVHKVTFRYEGQHSPALNELSLHLNPGEHVALMGPNGAGKSTLVDLLFGLRQPESGWVEIDGADVRTMRLETLREHVAVVKGIDVIEGTVLENVRMGRDTISQADVREVLRKVGLLDAVLALPDGLQTFLWTGGAPLSLGQANRLMVARAIVGQPRLLILDESLDHMDADIRSTVLPAILDRKAHWTLIVITHSEDVAKMFDRIIRLDRPAH